MNKIAIKLQNEKVELHCSSFLVFLINLYLCYLDLLTDEIFTCNSSL